LPDGGADIAILAGLNGKEPEYAAFVARYLDAGRQQHGRLVDFVREYLGDASLSNEAAAAAFAELPAEAQHALVHDVFYEELRATGRANGVLPDDQRDYSRGFAAISTLFPGKQYVGDVNLFFSRIYTLDGGNIDFLVPGGEINVGLASPPDAFGITKGASELGIVAQGFGSIRSFTSGDYNVNESRVFAADGGDILAWASRGDIDAGRGSKSSISAPPPVTTINAETGQVEQVFPPALTGSGIRALTLTPGREFGSVDLITPFGVVNASEAGIDVQGNLFIAATQVLGAQNITVTGGASVGVPVASVSVAATIAGSSGGASAAAAQSALAPLDNAGGRQNQDAGRPQSSIGVISVEVLGFGS
jgi:hypothetical protein